MTIEDYGLQDGDALVAQLHGKDSILKIHNELIIKAVLSCITHCDFPHCPWCVLVDRGGLDLPPHRPPSLEIIFESSQKDPYILDFL